MDIIDKNNVCSQRQIYRFPDDGKEDNSLFADKVEIALASYVPLKTDVSNRRSTVFRALNDQTKSLGRGEVQRYPFRNL